MASEHNVPAIHIGTGEPGANANEGVPRSTIVQPTSLTPGQETRDPFSSREGSILRGGSPVSARNPPIQSTMQAPPAPSPSDLERGVGGYSSPRPELNPLNTRGQGPSSGQPFPSPPPILRRQTDDYELRPQSGHSPRSQRNDPFSPRGSPNGSQQSNPNLPHSHSQNGSPGRQGRNEALDQPTGASGLPREEGPSSAPIGGHLRHALEDERNRLVGHLQGNQPISTNPNEGIGGRLRHALEEDRDELVDRIPGAYQHDPAHANEGFGSRLRHAAEGYMHDTFPNYHLPSLPGRTFHAGDDRRSRIDPHLSRTHSVIDHIVPVQHISESDEKYMPGSVNARLHSTVKQAEEERDKYATKAKLTGLALNVAIGLQVLLGSLTTGLSAVATQGAGKSAAVSTTILGALSTVVASYLARARGSNEPELSITRVKDLEQFIRECKNFQTDHGEHMGRDHDKRIEELRNRFESLLGNANGERKLSSAGVEPSHNNPHNAVKQQ
ncbi:hypothetical protein BDN70DRAFT_995834 [Pholiota conissans]|uniref:SMODS and SLOG-associating 2TM effector domain-containing protein n=1 Tax=Pholiota conissans TaxID=109636 RepID=A0A9P5YYA4_9AGAR|nr:hypothetical protein BDN70DRAFT_995834 [Pholiota conissans]